MKWKILAALLAGADLLLAWHLLSRCSPRPGVPG